MKMQRFSLVVALLGVFILSSCNTFKGLGKDIEGAGEAIQKAADKTKDAIKKK